MNDYPRPATGNELVAIKLEEFIRFYKPKNWRVPIHDVDFVPYVSKDDIADLRNGVYKNERFNKWYIREAIVEFFKQWKD